MDTNNITTTGKRNIKTNGYNSSRLWAHRDKLRQDAEERAEKYRSLSVDQRIDLVNKRIAEKGGQSKKELARLTALKNAPKKQNKSE